MVLAGGGQGGRGTESTDTAVAAREAAERLAGQTGGVVAASGEEDLVSDGQVTVLVSGGSAMLTKVTGAGCALGSLVAALLGAAGESRPERFAAVVAAHLAFGVASERAAAGAAGPGSFAVALIDELSRLDPDDLNAPQRLRFLSAAAGGDKPQVRAGFDPADLEVYLVTDRGQCGSRGVVETVRQAVDAGVRFVQLRDKDASDAEVKAQARQIAQVTEGRAVFVIDDRLEAVAELRREGVAVDGVHVGQGDTAPEQARALLGPDAVVGLSADHASHLEKLARLPRGTVDYLGVGPIHHTSTKPDASEPLGVDGFARFAAQAGLPCVAIGGVTLGDVAELKAAGAAGVAVVSAICANDDPAAAAGALVKGWAQARG